MNQLIHAFKITEQPDGRLTIEQASHFNGERMPPRMLAVFQDYTRHMQTFVSRYESQETAVVPAGRVGR